jgi:hypothetical protein
VFAESLAAGPAATPAAHNHRAKAELPAAVNYAVETSKQACNAGFTLLTIVAAQPTGYCLLLPHTCCPTRPMAGARLLQQFLFPTTEYRLIWLPCFFASLK